MKTPRFVAIVGGTLLALISARPALAQLPNATAHALPAVFNGGQGVPTDINDGGDVVGASQVSNTELHATLWRNGTPIDLCPGCTGQSLAYAINNSGQIVGYSQVSPTTILPFVTVNGAMTLLPMPAGYVLGIATAISETGAIVGYGATATAVQSAFRWDSADSAPQLLSLSSAMDINDAGDIAGFVTNACGQSRVAVLRAGVVEVLDTGDDCSYVTPVVGINQAGVVAGEIGGTGRLATWDGGTLTLHEPLAGFNTSVTGYKPINGTGDLVGTSSGGSLQWPCDSEATVWLPEGTIALPSTVAGGCGSMGLAMNRHAQTVGATFVNNAVVATLWIIDVDRQPPVVTAVATDNTIAPPSGKMVPVTFTGSITDGTAVASASFSITDEYGLVQPSGSITVGAAGQYSVTVMLEARRNPQDRDGRTYTFTATGSDPGGRSASASATAAVRVGKPAK